MTASGDETGLHLLVADEKEAYLWRTAATLSEPGLLTDQWIGQFCLTGSGRRAVVVYAPRQFTNRPELMEHGGFAAVVDLSTGAVTRLGSGASLAYHNPGCGVDETAVVSRQETTAGQTATRWGLVNAVTGAVSPQPPVPGQVTSAIPYQGQVVAVRGAALVAFGPAGRERTLAKTAATPFRLYPDQDAGLAFQTADNATVHFHRFAGTRVTEVGSAPLGAVKLRPGAGGRVFLAGHQATRRLPGTLAGGWKAVDTAPDSDMSTTGRLAVSRATTHREAAGRTGTGLGPDGRPDPVEVTAQTLNGSRVAFTISPPDLAMRNAAASGPAAQQGIMSPYDYSNVPYEPDRLCGISRNDPSIQVYQPEFHQVEWAANLAARGMLTFQRPANWSNNGLPMYSPQGLFPSIPLDGGGRVPAQVLLGILAQESNLWQASWHTVDGSAGNPLTSLGYYGLDLTNPDFLGITWHDAQPKVDCGYGVAQVTTGMRMDERGQVIDGLTITDLHQKTVALDYATNIAAGLRILQSKWNQTRAGGLIANNGDPQYIENWWFAIWAYNTGYYRYEDRASNNGAWGVGWANNPMNPDYPADRHMFLTAPLDVPSPGPGQPPIDDQVGYDNAKHPNHWSYPERVMGWAYTSLIKVDYRAHDFTPTYHIATLGIDKYSAQPPRTAFCAPEAGDAGGNECEPDDTLGPCSRPDLHCWWHYPKAWVDCAEHCGREYASYAAVEPRPLYDSIYPSQCATNGLPPGSKIIDEIFVTQKTGPAGCTPNWTRGGTFALKFASFVHNGYEIYPSKIDFHQIGGGFGGHFWFTHTRREEPMNQELKVTGTWTIDPTNKWTRVFVHVPDHGAHTGQADYRVFLPGETGSHSVHHRTIPTRWESNRWVDIGVFDFRGSGNPRIELSNFTADGAAVDDIAWDAIAVQPLNAKPSHFAVGLGDSYSSGEGAGHYTRVSDQYGDDPAQRNACRRGADAWARKIRLPNAPDTLSALAAVYDARVDFQFLACSGAKTHNLMLTGGGVNRSGALPGGSWKEVSQLDSGFLDENTTLVTLTIGGNDAGWSAIMKACWQETNCENFRPDGPYGQTLRTIVEDRIRNKIKIDVQRVVNEIRAKAPTALIVLAGYPHLVAPGVTLTVGPIESPSGSGNIVTYGIDSTENVFVNEMADLLYQEVVAGVAGPLIARVDVRTAFQGRELGDLLPYLNGWVPGEPGEPFPPIDDDGEPAGQWCSMECMHPNASGSGAYADAATLQITFNGYHW